MLDSRNYFSFHKKDAFDALTDLEKVDMYVFSKLQLGPMLGLINMKITTQVANIIKSYTSTDPTDEMLFMECTISIIDRVLLFPCFISISFLII